MRGFKWCDNCQLCEYSYALNPTLLGAAHWFCDKHKKEMAELDCITSVCIDFKAKAKPHLTTEVDNAFI
jgi:hypothetical protein